MEQLTPELERRIQVEELWARRSVLCDSMNAYRKEHFRARLIMLSRLGTDVILPQPAAALAGAGVPTNDQPAVILPFAPQPMRPAAPPVTSSLIGFLRFAGVAAAAALVVTIGLGRGDLIFNARAELGQVIPRLVQMISGSDVPSVTAAPVRAAAQRERQQDLRAEIAAKIAAAVAGKH